MEVEATFEKVIVHDGIFLPHGWTRTLSKLKFCFMDFSIKFFTLCTLYRSFSHFSRETNGVPYGFLLRRISVRLWDHICLVLLSASQQRPFMFLHELESSRTRSFPPCMSGGTGDIWWYFILRLYTMVSHIRQMVFGYTPCYSPWISIDYPLVIMAMGNPPLNGRF